MSKDNLSNVRKTLCTIITGKPLSRNLPAKNFGGKLWLLSPGKAASFKLSIMPVLEEYPSERRLLKMFSRKRKSFNFKEFIQCLSSFENNYTKEETTLRKLFEVYDFDYDGYISIQDLTSVMNRFIGNKLGSIQIKEMAKRAIVLVDQDGDEKISFGEFCKLINNPT